MDYPVPQPERYFYYAKKAEKGKEEEKKTDRSRSSLSKTTQEYTKHIQKYSRLFKSLPRVQEIYLCNSLSFNAAHPKSDIDLFIVVKSGFMRRARFWSMCLFFLFGQKRSSKQVAKKFCLSFFVSSDHKNIFPLAEREDVYLTYWLAHLVPLYIEEKSLINSIYKENSWIQKFLPNHPASHCIDLQIHLSTGKTRFKKIIEKTTKGYVGKLTQKGIKGLWLPIILYKKRKLGNKAKHIIVSDQVSKFYADKRMIYNTLFKKTAKKSQR